MGSSSSRPQYQQAKQPVKASIFQICARASWRTAGNLPWHDINEVDLGDRRFDGIRQDDVELILQRCGQYLERLFITDCCNSGIIPIVKKYCHNLELLGLTLSAINENDFIGAFDDMDKLNNLSLYVYQDEVRASPMDYTKILSSLRSGIKKIELSAFLYGDSALGTWNQNFQSSLDKFTALRDLTIGMFELDDHLISEISKRKTLEKLVFVCCTVKEGTSLELNLPNLLILELRKIPNISNCLMNITNVSKNLEYLNLESCEDLSIPALEGLSVFKNLAHLNLRGVTSVNDSVITSITNGCKNLKELFLPSFSEFSADALGSLSNLENLEKLDLIHVKNIDRATIIGIANHCTKLKHLFLDSCKNVPEAAFVELGKLANLEVLLVPAVENITDLVLLQLRNLSILKCDFCPKVTDVGIKHIIKNSPNLNFIFARDTGVTYNSLICAGRTVIRRKNNFVLHFTVNMNVAERFNKWKRFTPNIFEPYLDVEGNDPVYFVIRK